MPCRALVRARKQTEIQSESDDKILEMEEAKAEKVKDIQEINGERTCKNVKACVLSLTEFTGV